MWKKVSDYDAAMTRTLSAKVGKRWHAALATAALALGGTPAGAQTPVPTTPAPSALSAELFYQILVGELELRQGDTVLGFSLLLDAARQTNDAQLYNRSLEVALRARSGDGALTAARTWSRAFPQDRQANSQLLQILIALGKVADSAEPLKKDWSLISDEERRDWLQQLPQRYARVADKTLAASIVQQTLEPLLRSPEWAGPAWASVGRLRLAADDPAGALAAAREGLTRAPADLSAALLALELTRRKVDGAEALVRDALPRHSGVELTMGYVRVLVEQDRVQSARELLETLTRQSPQVPEAWLVLGSIQFEQGQAVQADASLARYVELAQQNPNPATPRGVLQAQARRAELLARQGKLEEGRQLIATLPNATQEERRSRLLTEVQLLREHRQWQAAYDLLASQSGNDVDLVYEQSMVAEKLGRFDEMERLLRQIMAMQPDHHNAYNALGFSLADRNIRLQEAKQLIVKAINLAPDDPFITDSLGWVEFRLGNLPAALLHLQKAFEGRADAEIAAHLGEVLWRLKRLDEARQIWREGLKIAPDNETLKETLQRLQPGL